MAAPRGGRFSRAEAPEAASTAADVFAEWVQLLAGRLRDDGINRIAAKSFSTTVVAALERAIIFPAPRSRPSR